MKEAISDGGGRGCGGGNADRDSGPTAHSSYTDPHACSDRDATHFRLELESACFLWSAFSDGNGRVAPHRGGGSPYRRDADGALQDVAYFGFTTSLMHGAFGLRAFLPMATIHHYRSWIWAAWLNAWWPGPQRVFPPTRGGVDPNAGTRLAYPHVDANAGAYGDRQPSAYLDLHSHLDT